MKKSKYVYVAAVVLGASLDAGSNAQARSGPTVTPVGSVTSTSQGASPGATPPPSGGQSSSFFGYSVAIDGTTAVVGAPNGYGSNGAAYVYVLSGSTWSLQQEITAADGAPGDQFGYTVAISGNTVLVGAAARKGGQGEVYAFVRSGTTWTVQQEFTSADGAANDCFGCALAIVGTTALIGAPNRLGDVGAAYLYSLASGLQLQHEFGGAASGDYFGISTALGTDAGTAVVGAFGASSETGEVYVFTPNGSWSQPPTQVVVKAADGQPGDCFGISVAAGEGQVLAGAFQIDSRTPGAAYVFSGGGASWSQQAKLVPSDGQNGDFFGFAVSLSGNTAVIGANQKPAGTENGSAYVFADSSGVWSQTEVVAQGANEDFGYAVAVSGANAIVGAFNYANQSGAGYFYQVSTQVVQLPALGTPEVLLLAISLAGLGVLAIRRTRNLGGLS